MCNSFFYTKLVPIKRANHRDPQLESRKNYMSNIYGNNGWLTIPRTSDFSLALVEITGRWIKVKLQKTPTKRSHRMFCILLKKVIKNHRCWIKKSNSVFFIHWEGLSFFSKPRHSNKHCLTELSLFCCTLLYLCIS